MNHFVRAKWLLLPSLLSGVTVLAATIIILSTASWSYITDNQLFYDHLFSSYGSITAITATPDNFAALRTALFNSATTYNVLVVIAAIAAGLITFVAFEAVRRFAAGVSVTVDEISHAHAPSKSTSEMLIRFGVRLLSLAGWVVYALIFLQVLLPVNGLLIKLALDGATMSSAQDLFYFIPAFGLLALGLHMHIIFVRLTLLRIRVLGGVDLKIEAFEEDAK